MQLRSGAAVLRRCSWQVRCSWGDAASMLVGFDARGVMQLQCLWGEAASFWRCCFEAMMQVQCLWGDARASMLVG
eukprot:3804104-Rhodomonas_salina.1